MLTNYQIKILAAVLMAIDHVGYALLDREPMLYFIGRLSFPLFIWLLVQGEKYTRNVWQYALRLLILGVISQPIYVLTFKIEPFYSDFNILFTLLVGLVCLRLSRLYPRFQILVWIVGAIAAELAKFNYGAYGIVLVVLIAHYRATVNWWLGWIIFHFLMVFILPNGFQSLAAFSALIFAYAGGRQGPKARWFYLFYPMHLLVLWLVKLALGMQAVGWSGLDWLGLGFGGVLGR